MGVSYQATIQARREGQQVIVTQFFTAKRVTTESPKKLAEAEEWVSKWLRENGTHDVHCVLSKVVWSIRG